MPELDREMSQQPLIAPRPTAVNLSEGLRFAADLAPVELASALGSLAAAAEKDAFEEDPAMEEHLKDKQPEIAPVNTYAMDEFDEDEEEEYEDDFADEKEKDKEEDD